jgi:hypothetical protein
MELMLAKMDSFKKKVEANQERLAAKTEANHEEMAFLKTQIGCLASCTDVNQEKADGWLEEMKAWRNEATACQEATEACLEKTEACLYRKEPTPVEVTIVAAHPGVPNEQTKVDCRSTGGPIWVLESTRRAQPKKRTQGGGGSRKKLAVVRRRMTCPAVPAWHKGRGHKGPTFEKR